ncbi:hypothetical protein ABGT15_04435 [Flavobacterium enshiense]|uniref:hypothetical protein n=1 Tax=Flavobacterium enshiense TaxID=1341165 RepID=UPI00345C856C
MTKLNKKFENIESLLKRDFDINETVNQLKFPNINVFFSWGVERLINYQNKGLLMLVNGHHHKGWVLITLAWNDTYSYYLLEGNKTIKVERHEVYCDELQYRIDQDVEYIEDYK